MDYILKQERLFKIMETFMLERFPELGPPLEKSMTRSMGNSGYGSGLDDYYKFTTQYIGEDGEPWFKKFDDRDRFEESKWEVNDKLEIIFNVFGEEPFVDFVKHYFNIDLREKGNKPWDWVFR